MAKSKTNKTDKAVKKPRNMRPAHHFIYKLSEAVLVYVSVDYLLQASNQIEVGIVAFALLWIATDVALWGYNNIVRPSAAAIIKNNK